MQIQQLNLKNSIHFRGAYRDYIHRDHEWVEGIKACDIGVDVKLTGGRTLVIPKDNIAAEMYMGAEND